jgi:putative transposase
MRAQGGLSIQRMCELAGINRASFYRHWEEKEPAAAETELRGAIQRLAVAYRYYGYRRIAILLQREGVFVGAKKVRRLMRTDNLLAIRRRKFVVTTDSDQRLRVWPNLAQYLELSDINQLWVADFTFVRLEEEFVYLAVVLDAYSRRVIGWSLGQTMNSDLAIKALKKALAARHPSPGFVHHSDQGSQYASMEYVGLLENSGAVLSMSRAGRPWENGRCESFIKTLKHEEIDARPYRTIEKLAEHVEEFIERIYNPVRLHSALAYSSPVEFEQRQELGKEAAAWLPASMSFPRHREISSDVLAQAQIHRDEWEARPGHSSE